VRQVVTFDAYGTLIDFRLSDTVRQVLADRLPMEGVDSEEFVDDFRVIPRGAGRAAGREVPRLRDRDHLQHRR
jgi:FMN phosphatase YigB (HAD superfamily)